MEPLYRIFKIENDPRRSPSLLLGQIDDTYDGSTPAKRPVDIAQYPYYKNDEALAATKNLRPASASKLGASFDDGRMVGSIKEGNR